MNRFMRHLRQVAVIAIVLLALLVGVIWYRSGMTLEQIWVLLGDGKREATIVILLLYLVKVVLWPIPLKALYVGAGLLFSPLYAIVLSYVGLCIQLTAGFYFGRSMGETAVRPLLGKNRYGSKFLSLADENASLAAFLFRLIPGPPTDAVNMLLGTLTISYPRFLLISLLAITPNMIPFVFMGDAVRNPLSIEFVLPFLVSAMILIITLFLRRYVHSRAEDREE